MKNILAILAQIVCFYSQGNAQSKSISRREHCRCLNKEERRMQRDEQFQLLSNKEHTKIYMSDSLKLVVIYDQRKKGCTKAIYSEKALDYFYSNNYTNSEFEMKSDSFLIADTKDFRHRKSKVVINESDSIYQELLISDARVFSLNMRDTVEINTSMALSLNRGRVDYYYWPSGAIKEIHRVIRRRQLVLCYSENGMLVSRKRLKLRA